MSVLEKNIPEEENVRKPEEKLEISINSNDQLSDEPKLTPEVTKDENKQILDISIIATNQLVSDKSNSDRESLTTSEPYSKNHDVDDNKILDKPKNFFGSRHIFALLGFLGLASVYLMRINLSVAIVDMVIFQPSPTTEPPFENHTSYFGRSGDESVDGQCPDDSTDGNENNGEFDWDTTTQGLILGAFYWGYTVTQIPGGILAERYGGKWVFGIGVILTDLFCVLTPLAARHGGIAVLIIVRILTGLAEGVTIPSANSMIAKWVPTYEKTSIGAFVLAGTQFGTLIALPLSGVLCDLELDGGWPLAFYVPGIVGAIWLVFWTFFVFDSPAVHPRIAEDEKRYILASTGIKKPIKFMENPWRKILTSIHFWAITVAHFGHSWGGCMLLTELPTYMKTVLHFDLKANGLLSALPYLAMWLFSIAFSITADALRRNQIFNTTVTRKVFTTIGLLLPACGLIGAGYTGCDRIATVTLLTLSCGFNGAIYAGYFANHIDIAPNYAGTMMGITNCIGSLCGFLAPYIVNVIVTVPGDLEQWQTVFFLAAGIYAATNLFYVVFGTGLEQPWNKYGNKDQPQEQIIGKASSFKSELHSNPNHFDQN